MSSSRLPVLPTAAAAYRDVFSDFPGFLRAIWVILLLLMVVVEVPMLFLSDYVNRHVVPELQQQMQDMEQKQAGITPADPASPGENAEGKPANLGAKMLVALAGLVLNMLQMILIFCFTYAWYRQLLTGEEKGKTIRFRLTKPEWQLMWTSIKVGFVILPLFFLMFGVVSGALPQTPDGPMQYNVWPYLAVMGLGLVYLQARMALAYPATVMGETEAPVRLSWNLTRQQGFRLVAGNFLIVIPMILGILALFYGLSWILEFIVPMTETGGVEGEVLPLIIRFILKVVAVTCILLFVSLISAFHAHAYAYLVRSSSSASVN